MVSASHELVAAQTHTPARAIAMIRQISIFGAALVFLIFRFVQSVSIGTQATVPRISTSAASSEKGGGQLFAVLRLLNARTSGARGKSFHELESMVLVVGG